jgi:hypothetical protein
MVFERIVPVVCADNARVAAVATCNTLQIYNKNLVLCVVFSSCLEKGWNNMLLPVPSSISKRLIRRFLRRPTTLQHS